MSASNDNFFTSSDLYRLTSLDLGTSKVVEELPHSSIVMSGPHCLDMLTDHFLPRDSHPDLVLLIENSSFQEFWGFQEDCFEFHSPIYDFHEEYYLSISSPNNKFQYFSCLLRRMAQMKVHSK